MNWKLVSIVAVASFSPLAFTHAQPEGNMPPDMEANMQAYAQAGTPGEMHAYLTRSVGTWDGQVRMWFMPGMDPQESTCTTVVSSMFGGRFTKVEVVGDMGPMGRFEGFGVYGYNNTTEQFEGTWLSNMGTHITNSVGELSEDGRTLTWRSDFICPRTSQPVWMREVERRIDENTMVLEMYGPGPDGDEYKMMEIRSVRRAEEPDAEVDAE